MGPTAFCNSTLVKLLNAQDYQGACDAILKWRMAGGVDCSAPGNKTCPGLWARRVQTRNQCLGSSASGATL
ncbi:lysozyme [Candidatus Aalborgicola defluviihabitans]|uniref:lysozyme n=1 Tax=Candidatus Aalborgicola defluviihabitans TaxID=3386187 RepID=UPI0039B9AA88